MNRNLSYSLTHILWFLVFVSVALFVLINFQRVRSVFVDGVEDAHYMINPSPELAYAYGEQHFDVFDPGDYDIDRAQYFFSLAAAQDPDLPYVYHQLARISFLKSNFKTALAEIDFQISIHGDSTPPAYYVRGLIEGYTGDYADAEVDYAHFLKLVPNNWAGLNDYAWVLLKDNKPQQAAAVTETGLGYYPDNPWLLNSNATALYEAGDIVDAREVAARAAAAVATLTPQQWSVAYPGNNPDIASEGVATFKQAVADNMHTIDAATTTASR